MLSRILKIDQHAAHTILFFLLIIFVFVDPVFPESWQRLVYLINFTFILIYSILALDKGREKALPLALVNFVLIVVAYIFQLMILDLISRVGMVIFFGIIVVRLVMQVAANKNVNMVVILNSISGYLLLGVFFGLILMIFVAFFPESFNLQSGSDYLVPQMIYYSFVTMTTLGYGDIVPTISVTRSMAILMSVTGQFYIAIIVAMLVSKYISGRKPA